MATDYGDLEDEYIPPYPRMKLEEMYEYLEQQFNKEVKEKFQEMHDDTFENLNSMAYSVKDAEALDDYGFDLEECDGIEGDDEEMGRLFTAIKVCFGYEKEANFVKLLSQLNFNVSKTDIDNAKKYIISQIPGFVGIEDKTFFELQAVGLKNKIPIMPLLNDLYQFWRLHTKQKDIGENEWVASSKYLSSIKDKKKKELIIGGIRSYGRRILPSPMINPQVKLNDSLSDYIKLVLNATECVKNFIDTNDASLPLQIDLWIIPKNAHKTETGGILMVDLSDDDEDDDDDDDDEEKDSGNNFVELGDIEGLLKKDKIKFVKDKVDASKGANCVRTMRGCMEKVIGDERSKRLVMIIDRRKSDDDSKGNDNDIYCYKPPKPFGSISNDYCIEKLINNTNKYICPHPNDEPMNDDQNEVDLKSSNTPIGGSFVGSGREFCLSFHIHEKDKIECYMWMHGFGVRFLPKYLTQILPKYFVKNCNDLKQNKIDDKYVNDKFKIQTTDKRFDEWNKQINDKYAT